MNFQVVTIAMVLLADVSLLGYAQMYPSYPWNYPALQYQYDQPRPIPQQRPIIRGPIIPGSPQWKRLEFIKKYQAFQRSKTGDVKIGPTSKADHQLSLQDAVSDSNVKGLQGLDIKGIATYKPGGSGMILSLIVQGPPGIMPGTSAPAGLTGTPAPFPPAGPSGTPAPFPPASPPSKPVPFPQEGPSSTTAPSPPAGSSSTLAPFPPAAPPSKPAPFPQEGPSSTPAPFPPAVTSGSGNGSGSTGGSFQAFETAALDEHNKFRKVHGSQPMRLNRQMCDEAAAYAKIIASNQRMQHSTREQRNGQGENLSMGCSTSKGQTTIEAVDNWYNEVCDPGYEFRRGRGQSGTGHFTQVVWNDSVELGIGKAESMENGMKCTYIVGRYKPLGNLFTGNQDYKKNVKQGSFNRAAYCTSIKNKGGFKKSASYLGKVLKRKK